MKKKLRNGINFQQRQNKNNNANSKEKKRVWGENSGGSSKEIVGNGKAEYKQNLDIIEASQRLHECRLDNIE